MTKFFQNKIATFLATLFYIGYFPYASGTIGSLFSFVVLWFFLSFSTLSIVLFFFVSVFSIFVCDIAEKNFNKKDDGRIVLDEFVGSFFSVVFLPKVIFYYISAFILFRIFDITKPLGIKKIQNIKGGLGIVIDDVFAGILANLVLVAILYLKNI
jgi:phosphatidylglycerophosphatase A